MAPETIRKLDFKKIKRHSPHLWQNTIFNFYKILLYVYNCFAVLNYLFSSNVKIIFNNSFSTENYKRTKGPKTPILSDLTSFQKEVIYGSMLGDLHAERYSLNGNTRLRFFMSVKNKEYMYHLYDIFKTYIKTPPKIVTRKKVNKLTGHIQTDIFMSTLKYSYFNFAREEFYKPIYLTDVNNKNKFIKIIPLDIEDKLTEVGLAY